MMPKFEPECIFCEYMERGDKGEAVCACEGECIKNDIDIEHEVALLK